MNYSIYNIYLNSPQLALRANYKNIIILNKNIQKYPLLYYNK